MLFDVAFCRAPTVFGGAAVGKMPFYEGSSGDKGDIVKVDDLGVVLMMVYAAGCGC